MTEYSRPWPGTTIGDAGPYTSNDWNDVWGTMENAGVWTGDPNRYDIGVFYQILNHLEPAVNGATIEVETGASLVDGLYHYCDSLVTIPIPASGAGTSRIDVVVVRKNYQQAVTYTPGGGAPTVPPRTARITVIRGVEAVGPVAPSLTQDVTRTTYWDIPLAQVQVSDAGVLSGFVDLREYADAEIKIVAIPVLAGYNVTTATDVPYAKTAYVFGGVSDSTGGVLLVDGDDSQAFSGIWIVPNDFISDCSVTALVQASANGNMYCAHTVYYGTCGENRPDFDDYGFAAVAVTTDINCIADIDLTSPAIGDMVEASFDRDAGDPLDTVNDDAYIYGWRIQYLGWKK